jgi:hypothetical protein
MRDERRGERVRGDSTWIDGEGVVRQDTVLRSV